MKKISKILISFLLLCSITLADSGQQFKISFAPTVFDKSFIGHVVDSSSKESATK